MNQSHSQDKKEADKINKDAKAQFAKLTVEDIKAINGHKAVLSTKLQKAYSITKEDADEQVKEFLGE